MSPEARMLSEVNRMFGILTHPAPIPTDDRVICADCGRAVHEVDANWHGEQTPLCDACEADRIRADAEEAEAVEEADRQEREDMRSFGSYQYRQSGTSPY